MDDMEKHEEKDIENSQGPELRCLTIHISTRDLLLPQADSLAGLRNMLTFPPCSSSLQSGSSIACATWVTEGLIYLTSLRQLTMVVEMSVPIGKHFSVFERRRFVDALSASMPRVLTINVQWKIQERMILGMDDHEWMDFMWLNDAVTIFAIPGLGQVGGDGTTAEAPVSGNAKVGFANWLGVPS
ncbi:uncharacterized protein Z518_10339 [Rhinocladiella mackenziei CBS 650.93]|uniref:Uncharacterized protein n=1 Tax=Rhinocladiella mackenziei CBS 650.93 TaxID=1442369 RepID=A0A0D2IAC7_9EURO|nr:uncharacterized protein Z518_10339 [Rhinocladiella mackenziei CBS 650.93]KIX00201.1 hypothetical protein Z518_10339 [Rhinocladiella mackenziei CBS 650.93]